MAVYPFSHRKVFIGAGPIRTSGHTSDLKAGELALADGESFSLLPVGTTYSAHPVVRLVQGSYRQVDVLALGHGGGKESIKSRPIDGHYISDWRVAFPKRARNHVIAIGFANDGDDTKTMAVEKDKVYKLRVTVKGSPVSRFINHDLYNDFIVKTSCLGKCEDPCTTTDDAKAVAESFAKQINEHPFISPFVKAEAVFECDPALTANPSNVDFVLYTLEVCDTGDSSALAEVQRQYPTRNVTRTDRRGSTSVYEICIPDADPTPADFTYANSRVIPNCATCPSGYTLHATLYKVEVKRADVGSGGNLTTVISNYSASQGERLSYEFGTSTYVLYFTTSTVPAAVGTDVVVGGVGHVESVCTLNVATTVDWIEGDARYKTTRTLHVSIGKTCGGSNRLSELTAFYANDASIVANSLAVRASGDCADVYEVEQYNKECLLDPCSGQDIPSFDALQSFEGFVWVEDEAALPEDTTCLAGVRLSSAYVETKFGNCSWDPYDHYELEIPKIDVSQIDESGDPCETVWPVTELQTPQFASGTGEMVKRELITFMASRQDYFFCPEGSRMNETQDVNSWLSVIDRSKFYKVYYLVHNVPYKNNHTNLFDNEQYELMIAFPEEVDTTNFEKLINSYVTSVGVQLKAL